jgi:hypothetical protein
MGVELIAGNQLTVAVDPIVKALTPRAASGGPD